MQLQMRHYWNMKAIFLKAYLQLYNTHIRKRNLSIH